jgi:hypothetical protein
VRNLILQRAIFGERNGAHDLLAWSGEKELFRSLAAMDVDLPDQPSAGLVWAPFIRGWRHSNHYLFSRTEPDSYAKRRGMVRTQLIAVLANVTAELTNITAILDALNAAARPVIELHLSNVFRREGFRHHSYVSAAAQGVICGFGPKGYELAVEAMADMLASKKKPGR